MWGIQVSSSLLGVIVEMSSHVVPDDKASMSENIVYLDYRHRAVFEVDRLQLLLGCLSYL
jgi:hypothetical protein